ncbi:hypothetical protein HKD37_20G055718 [Glycine soja]
MENSAIIIDPPSPIARHMKWKMAQTKQYRQMISIEAQQTSEKIDDLQEHTMQGSFVPDGHEDILNTALGRPEHLGRVHVAGHGVTINQYFGQALRASNTSSATITPDQLGRLAHASWLLSSKGMSSPNTKGSRVEAAVNVLPEEPSIVDVTTMGLYIVHEECTQLVALVYDADMRVPFPMSKIQYVRNAVNTFIAWPTHLVKPLSDDSHNNVPKSVGRVERCNLGAGEDPLGELMKILYDIYLKPVALTWDGMKYELPNVEASFFITHAYLTEIIPGDKCLNMSILQLWMIGHGFLEPQSIPNAKDRHQQCQQYIKTWVKESQRQLYLGAYLNQAHLQLVVVCPRDNIVVWFCSLRKKPDINIKVAINSAMKTITSTFEGMLINLHLGGLKRRVMLVGWGGNNGSTLIGGVIAN